MESSTAGGVPQGHDEVDVGDRLPLGPIRRRTNLLVEGPRTAGARDVLFELLTAGRTDRESTVLISTECAPADVLALGEAASERFGLVTSGPEHTDSPLPTASVSTPADLTGMGIQFVKLADRLAGDHGTLRVGLDTITTILHYADDPRNVFRFLHAFTGRVGTAGGFGVYHIDPGAHDDRTVSVMRQPFDARIVVRDEDGPELRVQGLPNAPTGWVPFDL